MSGEKIVACVDCSSAAFLKALYRVKEPQRRSQVLESIRAILLLDLDQVPAKYHLHRLTNKAVSSALNPAVKVAAWSMHVTRDDTLKASFTFENGTVHFRRVDDHDSIDKNP